MPKLKCISNKYVNYEERKLVVLEYERLNMIMVDIYYYLERENYEVLKFHRNNCSYFKISTSF